MRRGQLGWRHFRQRTDGMSAVEFALILPVMLLIVCGILDFGNLFYQMTVVNEAAREAARYAATYKSGGNPPNKTTVQTYINNIYPNVTLSQYFPNPPSSGSPVTATITQSVRILTPVINQLIPNNPTTVTGTCSMQVE
jgi:Flp pilus assembly protein TadG